MYHQFYCTWQLVLDFLIYLAVYMFVKMNWFWNCISFYQIYWHISIDIKVKSGGNVPLIDKLKSNIYGTRAFMQKFCCPS